LARGDTCDADTEPSRRSQLVFDWQDSWGLIWYSSTQLRHAFDRHPSIPNQGNYRKSPESPYISTSGEEL